MLILSDKLLLDIQLLHTFMPNMIHKPWMVSSDYGNFRVSVIRCSYLQCRGFLENISYLQLYILRLCLGGELPHKNFLELRVLCPAMIRCNFCLNKSLSKSWLDNHQCSSLQLLLDLSLISPLNDEIVLGAGTVLKFEKKYLACEYIY